MNVVKLDNFLNSHLIERNQNIEGYRKGDLTWSAHVSEMGRFLSHKIKVGARRMLREIQRSLMTVCRPSACCGRVWKIQPPYAPGTTFCH